MSACALCVLAAFLIAVTLTPAVRRLAVRLSIVDQPGRTWRKTHQDQIPRVGGVAIVTATHVPLACALLGGTAVLEISQSRASFIAGLLGGSVAIAILGFVDDIRGLSPAAKLGGQTLCACAVVALGFSVDQLYVPLLGGVGLGFLGFPLTVLWIVAVTNAVNLIDGLDGLAAGVALLGLVPALVLAVMNGNALMAIVACCLVGALLGFLVFNSHPATIFMGDTGSMFLGFMLAVVTVQATNKSTTSISMLVPILALGLPVVDTTLAVARRAWLGQPIFGADRGHIHHRLLRAGLGHRRAVLVLYSMAAGGAAMGLVVALYREIAPGVVLVAVLVAVGVITRQVAAGRLPSKATALVRTRNRLVRRSLRRFVNRINASLGLDDAMAAASCLADIAGATAMRIEIVGKQPDVARVIRSWGDVPQGPGQQFPLVSRTGQLVGEVTLWWTEPVDLDDAIALVVEPGCDALAEICLRFAPEPRAEEASTTETQNAQTTATPVGSLPTTAALGR